jgi:hypothetical protein
LERAKKAPFARAKTAPFARAKTDPHRAKLALF